MRRFLLITQLLAFTSSQQDRYQSPLHPTQKRERRYVLAMRLVDIQVPRGELCSYLRAAITEQRRIDASYASLEGSISSSQAAALSVEARPDKDFDIRLILPPEPLQQVKGGKVKPNRKHRHTTKVSSPSLAAGHTDDRLYIWIRLPVSSNLLDQRCRS